MAGWFDGAWWDGDWWSGQWWSGGGPQSGGGAVPEEFAFSIKNQRVSNHAAAAARSVLKPAGFLDDDSEEWVKSVQAESARAHRRILLQEQEEEEIMLLLMLGFE